MKTFAFRNCMMRSAVWGLGAVVTMGLAAPMAAATTNDAVAPKYTCTPVPGPNNDECTSTSGTYINLVEDSHWHDNKRSITVTAEDDHAFADGKTTVTFTFVDANEPATTPTTKQPEAEARPETKPTQQPTTSASVPNSGMQPETNQPTQVQAAPEQPGRAKIRTISPSLVPTPITQDHAAAALQTEVSYTPYAYTRSTAAPVDLAANSLVSPAAIDQPAVVTSPGLAAVKTANFKLGIGSILAVVTIGVPGLMGLLSMRRKQEW